MEHSESVEVQSSVESAISAPAPVAPVQEKMVPQSTVDNAIKHAKYETEQRTRQKLEAEWSQRQATQTAPSVQAAPNIGNMISRDELPSLYQEMREKERHQELTDQRYNEAARTAGEFTSKIEAGKSAYSDFDAVVGDINNLGAMPDIVRLANGVDNCADVIYELKKNPEKIPTFLALARVDPNGAKIAMNKLSQSIKLNQEAAQAKTAKAPLSQIRPTHVGVDNGPETVNDFRSFLKNRRK